MTGPTCTDSTPLAELQMVDLLAALIGGSHASAVATELLDRVGDIHTLYNTPLDVLCQQSSIIDLQPTAF